MKTHMKVAVLATAMAALLAGTAQAQTKVTYLFPAPDFLPAFSPFQIARAKGYYKAEGLGAGRSRSARAARMSPSRSASAMRIWGAASGTPRSSFAQTASKFAAWRCWAAAR